MDSGTPTVNDGHIYFPEGTDISLVRKEKCHSNCPLSLECSGPFSQGGGVVANVYKDKISDAEIKDQAACFMRGGPESK